MGCGAPAAATSRERACWDRFTAFGRSSVLRLVLRTQPRSGGSVMRSIHSWSARLRLTGPRLSW